MTPWFLHCFSQTRENAIITKTPVCSHDDDGIILEEGFDRLMARDLLLGDQHHAAPQHRFSTARYTNRFGIHRPRCRGMCLIADCGSHNKVWVTLCLLLAPALVFALVLAPEMVHLDQIIALCVCSLLFLLCFMFMLLTWFVEPGILPHCEVTDEDFMGRQSPKRFTLVFIKPRYYHLSTFRAMKSKWTGTVIEEYDHWCPYLGNAVGVRNYRYYILFMTLCMFTCLVNVAVMVYMLHSMSVQCTNVHEFWHQPVVYVAILFALFCLGMAVSLSCLVAHHWQMVCSGMTSLEASKDVFKGMPSPYDMGWKRNLCAMFCSPHLPSRVVGEVDLSPANNDTPTSGGEHLLIHDTFDAVFSPPPSPMFPAAPRAPSYSNSPIMVACLSEEDEEENLQDEEERL